MVLICISHAITHKITILKKVLPLDSLLRSIRNFIIHEYPKITCTNEYKLFIDGVQGIFNIFTHSGIFSNVTKERVNDKDQIRYYFPVELSENLGKFTTTPRIYKPNTVTDSNIMDYIYTN